MSRATSQTKKRELIFEDYMALPEMKGRHDVIDGILMMSPSPIVSHQLILQNVYDAASPYVRLHDLGTILLAPCDLLIRKTPKLRVRQPDLMFIARNRSSREALKKVQILEFAPDFAVEIISPSNTPKRWTEKLSDYASIQLPELWRVDAYDESVEVHALVEGSYCLERRFEGDMEVQSRLLPGLAIRVSALFE